MDRSHDRPLYGFFRPFFDRREGQIFILSAPKDHIRDGLAVTQIARIFGIPENEGITLEPSRSTVLPGENVILVGRSSLFVDRGQEPVRGRRPVAVGYEKLGQRLERISRACCYQFRGNGTLALTNSVSGASYEAQERDEHGREVDYAVIRRVFRCPSENTILLEGIHGLGTLGAAKIATSRAHLEEIWSAVRQIDGFDPTLPLEILVRTTFAPELSQSVYALNAMEARVTGIVYNRTWSYDMDSRCWVDQEPYDINIESAGDRLRALRERAGTSVPSPWLELRADLRHLDPRTRELCRRLLGRGNGHRTTARERAERRRLLRRLTSSSDLIRLRLYDEAEWGAVRIHHLPNNPSDIRLLRKRFLIHLIFCNLLGIQFHCRESEIRAYYPELSNRRGGSLVARFTSTINGRMREGFQPLLGKREEPKGYLRIQLDRREKIYRLLLQQIRVVARLRL